MAANWEAHYSKGTIGARPAANTLPKGAIYYATDENKYYVGSGSANTWADFAGPFMGTAGGTFSGDIVLPDEAYDATGWNGNNEAPTKNAVRDVIEALKGGVTSAFDTLAEIETGKASLAGATFTGDVNVPDEAYDATNLNGSTEVPTKNAVRDKIEALSVGGGGAITAIAGAEVGTDESTSSTSYTDLATTGPSVTLTTGTEAYVTIAAGVYRAASSGSTGSIGVDVSGASTIAASSSSAAFYSSPGAGLVASVGTRIKLTGLTPGSNTFTLKYKSDSGAATFNFFQRRIVVEAV